MKTQVLQEMCFVYFFVSLLFAFETEGGGEERKLLCFLEYILLRLKEKSGASAFKNHTVSVRTLDIGHFFLKDKFVV